VIAVVISKKLATTGAVVPVGTVAATEYRLLDAPDGSTAMIRNGAVRPVIDTL